MVVTNLRLNVDKLPNTIMIGDPVEVRARLFEDGKTVTNPSLLSKTQFDIKEIDTDDRVASTELLDNGTKPDVIKGDGVYSGMMENIEKPGAYELSIRARSQTFTRAVRHSLQVHDSPANYMIKQEAEGKPFIISVQPHAGLIRPDSVSMQITLPDSEPLIVKQVEDMVWSVEVPATHANKTFKLTMAANRYNDEHIKMDFEQALTVTEGFQSLAYKPPVHAKAEEPHAADTPPAAEAHAPGAEESAQEHATEEVVSEEQEGFSWTIVLIIIVVVNLLVMTGGWFAYRTWRKRQTAKDEAVAAELEK
jgi:uncharacterized protein (TIGR03503 family)